MQEGQERVLRVKAEVYQDLADLRAALTLFVKARRYTPEQAWDAYNDALAQTLQNPHAYELDDREYFGVKCRDCGHTSSVPKDVDFWDCFGCGSTRRHAFIDMVRSDGSYVLNDDAITFQGKDVSHVRAKALAEGATLEEADQEAARA